MVWKLVPTFAPALIALVLSVVGMSPAQAQVLPFPAGFTVQDIKSNGTTIHVRVGGHGPAVILLHGYGETGDMWAPLAIDLMRDHQVIVPISAVSACRPGRPADMTRRRKARMSPACWTG